MPWMVAVANARSRDFMEASLDRGGFSHYSPQYLRRLGARTRAEKLFGRYVFVYFTEFWRYLFTTPGIAGVLTSGPEIPALVSDGWVDEVRSKEDRHGFVRIENNYRLRRGQRVRVTAGPLSFLTGTFAGLDSADRETALITVMGRAVRVSLAAGSLAAD